jgi:hypothetical protein
MLSRSLRSKIKTGEVEEGSVVFSKTESWRAHTVALHHTKTKNSMRESEAFTAERTRMPPPARRAGQAVVRSTEPRHS